MPISGTSKQLVLDALNTNSEFQASMPTSKRGLNRRSTLRALAKSLDVGISTLHRKFKLGLLRHHSITLKPHLKERNKRERLQFCISMLDQTSLGDAEPRLIDMQNIIHMDEKWYYMTKKARKYYLLQEEDGNEGLTSDCDRTKDIRNACISSILRVGISCSKETPTDRVQIGDALKELQRIRDRFLRDSNQGAPGH